MRTPVGAKAVFYIGIVTLMGLILTTTLKDLLPNKIGIFVANNSEAYMALLILCPWIDWVRPRLQGLSYGWGVSLFSAAALVVAGFFLRSVAWPGQFVTLNEALFGCAVLLPYLQQRRPRLPSTLVLIVLSIAVPALSAGQSVFVTDMAEAFGVIIAGALVVGLIDTQLLAGEPVHRARNLWAALIVFVLMSVVKVFTPGQPEGIVENTSFYVQRANEGFVVAIVLLCYYATRSTAGVREPELSVTR